MNGENNRAAPIPLKGTHGFYQGKHVISKDDVADGIVTLMFLFPADGEDRETAALEKDVQWASELAPIVTATAPALAVLTSPATDLVSEKARPFLVPSAQRYEPERIAPVFVPSEILGLSRWLVYKLNVKDGKTKADKVPFNPRTGRPTNDPSTGLKYNEALAAYLNAANDYEGLGLYVESPFVGTDLDSCRNKETGEIAPWAMEAIQCLNSYTEVSPSGTGVHILTYGVKPGERCKRGQMEMYSDKRFLTFTGNRVPNTPTRIECRDMKPLYDELVAGKFVFKSEDSASCATVVQTEVSTDGKLGVSDTTDQSKSGEEWHLICDLIDRYQQNPDPEVRSNAAMIEEDFRSLHEGMYRPKWDSLRNGKTYLSYTIERALKQKAERFETKATTTVEATEASAEVEDFIDEPLPEFPLVTGSLSELADALFPDIPREFKIMAAVTHWGLLRSGLDTLENEPHIQPRTYTCFVADPWRGKTAAINEIRNIMSAVSSRYSRCSSVDSGPALVDEFAEQAEKMNSSLSDDKAARVLIDCDELKDLFEKSKVSPQGRNSLFTEMLKLFEGNRTGNRSRKAGKTQLENAHLGILAGATTEGYPTMWTGTGGGASGLQSRFILVGTNASKISAEQRPSDGTRVAAALERLQNQVSQPGQKIRITAEASSMFRTWWDSSPRDKGSEARIPDLIKRLLIVLAVTNDADTVDAALMGQGIAFGNYEIAVRERFNPADSHSWTQAFENAIIKAFQRRKYPMTVNDARRLVQPTRKPGGVGPFLQATKNLIVAGILKPCGNTERATRYRL